MKYHGHIMDRGTTSACAENTASRIPKYHMTWNYLRVRGEYNPCSQKTGLCRELPPRARRILVLTIWLTRLIGTTSACAENTRGTVFCQVDGGTTSACAENTHPATHNNALSRNYLRVRGEYPFVPPDSILVPELPPRARRIPLTRDNARSILGTTSACAENTTSWLASWRVSRNYLRVRGEYGCFYCFGIICEELPPRARRIPLPTSTTASKPGTTSACAENT